MAAKARWNCDPNGIPIPFTVIQVLTTKKEMLPTRRRANKSFFRASDCKRRRTTAP